MNFINRNSKFVCKAISLYHIRNLTMTSNVREKAVVESLKSNPYFDKYAGRILEKQKVSPEEFYSQLEELEKRKLKENQLKSVGSNDMLSPGKAKTNLTEQHSNTDTLDKIMKLDLIKDKNVEEIKKIWEDFHKSKENMIAASVPINAFKLIKAKSTEHPIFLLPLPRSQGYEFIMLQFAGTKAHFTPLISYQTHRENAPECLTIIYYTEIADEKGIVLMKGEYDKNTINAMEAQCLANQLQLFYGENNEKRDKLMARFTHYPDEFRHMDLIAEIECLSF